MKRASMWAGLLAVFACGLAIGAVSGSLCERHQAAERFRQIRHDKGAFLTGLVLGRLQKTLDLSPQQKAGIEPILLEGFRSSLKVREEIRPHQDRIMQETTERVRALLTPEQAHKLQENGEWKLLLPKPPPGRP
ncbi:hypothetical protein AAU61_00080 [Desulfocarbo indianensis]|nr:hypothetical protein AAU61_00080 [Desulfocarbo indianensis]